MYKPLCDFGKLFFLGWFLVKNFRGIRVQFEQNGCFRTIFEKNVLISRFRSNSWFGCAIYDFYPQIGQSLQKKIGWISRSRWRLLGFCPVRTEKTARFFIIPGKSPQLLTPTVSFGRELHNNTIKWAKTKLSWKYIHISIFIPWYLFQVPIF